MISYIRTNDGYTGIVGNRSFSFNSGHLNYEYLVAILKQSPKERDERYFTSLLNIEAAVKESVSVSTNTGNVEVKNGLVYYRGRVLNNNMTERILAIVKEGGDCGNLVKFLENLMENPSQRSIEELYDFLQNKCLPITDDGHFLAYKSVDGNFYSKAAGDLHLIKGRTDREDGTGHIYNAVGEEILCPRNEVDDDRQHQCSKGLHCGGLDYSGPGGWYNSANDNVIIVKVNPAHVVSVPLDHQAQKLRTHGYKVIGLYAGALERPVYRGDGGEMENRRQVEVPLNNGPTYRSYDELVEGDEVKFVYTKSDGSRSTRYLAIEDKHDSYIAGTLLNPEEEVGEYRRFNKSGITNLQLLVFTE